MASHSSSLPSLTSTSKSYSPPGSSSRLRAAGLATLVAPGKENKASRTNEVAKKYVCRPREEELVEGRYYLPAKADIAVLTNGAIKVLREKGIGVPVASRIFMEIQLYDPTGSRGGGRLSWNSISVQEIIREKSQSPRPFFSDYLPLAKFYDFELGSFRESVTLRSEDNVTCVVHLDRENCSELDERIIALARALPAVPEAGLERIAREGRTEKDLWELITDERDNGRVFVKHLENSYSKPISDDELGQFKYSLEELRSAKKYGKSMGGLRERAREEEAQRKLLAARAALAEYESKQEEA